jgi:hypothetical protein
VRTGENGARIRAGGNSEGRMMSPAFMKRSDEPPPGKQIFPAIIPELTGNYITAIPAVKSLPI